MKAVPPFTACPPCAGFVPGRRGDLLHLALPTSKIHLVAGHLGPEMLCSFGRIKQFLTNKTVLMHGIFCNSLCDVFEDVK